MIEDGLFSLFKNNPAVQDFWGKDNNGNPEFQFFYLGVFDPVETPPYCVLTRRRREPDEDLNSTVHLLESEYTLVIYDTDSWGLLNLQQTVRSILESLPLTTVGGIYIQKLIVTDDYHMIPPAIQEVRIRYYTGILQFVIIHNPND